jgi:hypothetical protein
MQTRKHTIFSGRTFTVPTYIVRLDGARSHGWQLRLGRWKLFSDHSNDGSGASRALKEAKDELARRLATMPARTGLRTAVSAGKGNDLPLGISGPHARTRAGKAGTQYYVQVTYPVFGGSSVNRSIYVATENTLTRDKWERAVEKAIRLRAGGVRAFKLAATKAQREAAAKLKAGKLR